MIFIFVSAWAMDASGPPVVAPASESPSDPVVTWSPDPHPTPGVLATLEVVDQPLVRTLYEGDDVQTIPLLDDLYKLSLVGRVPLGRTLAIAVNAPLFLHSTWMEEENGVETGDLRVGLPMALVRSGGDGFGAGLVPELVVPTGNAAHFLGADQFSASLVGYVGQNLGVFDWSLNLGAALAPADVADQELDPNLRRVASLKGAAAVGWRARPWLGLGMELWTDHSLEANQGPAPTEWLGRVGVQLPKGFHLNLAGGRALNGAAGSANARGYLSLGWSAVPRPATPVPLVETPSPPPRTMGLRVTAVDEGGAPVDATVTIGDTTSRLGADGTEEIPLPSGLYQVEVSAEGRSSQRRMVSVRPDAWRSEEVSAVLPKAEGGNSLLHLELVDLSGAPVEGAQIAVDGSGRGKTANGGTLDLLGLNPGKRTISVEAADYQPVAPLVLSLGDQQVSQRVLLSRPPGSLKVVAHAPSGTVEDALIRLEGPESLPPVALGPTGEHSFVLSPGIWTVILSAPHYGLQEREVVIEAESPPQDLEFVLHDAEAGQAELVVRVVDPSGAPVEAATVQMDDHPLGATGSGGELRVAGLRPGSRKISVSGNHFRPTEPREVVLVEGTRESRFVLGWLPGSVQVVARGPEGSHLDAKVRWIGPVPLPDSDLGPDGREFYSLEPGQWELVLSSTAYGLQQRDLVVRPEDQQLVEIEAGLLRDEGDAILSLTLLNAEDQLAEGLEARVDGQPVGTVAGGHLKLEGLAVGTHRLELQGSAFRPLSQNFTLSKGNNAVTLHVPWAPARLLVTAKAGEEPVSDALLRMMGANVLPPVPVDRQGQHLFPLEPGRWTLVASSERFGIGELDLDVVAAPQIQNVEIRMQTPQTSRAQLLVEVTGPGGAPVVGLKARVNGTEVKTVDGKVLLPDLPVEPLHLSLSAPGYLDSGDLTIPLVEGPQERRVSLKWQPRSVQFAVRDGEGKPIPATLQLVKGRERLERQVKGDAELMLLPGDWKLVVAPGAEWGAREETVRVEAGEGSQPVELRLERTRVQLTQKEVVIREQVFFAFNGASIEERSFPVLAEVATTLRLHPELGVVEVQGHTDAVGDDAYNLDLSQRRADAVRDWLIRSGVEPERLVARGYGTSKPLSSNQTEAGRQKNRRVQFEILSKSE